MEVAGVRTDASMQSLLPLFQLYRRSPDILSQLGVEDLLYRHSVMLLRPDLFEKSNLSQSSSVDDVRQRRLLDPLCEYIMGHLSDSLTLTDLEAISGMSARSLQLAFNARFGITPMAWIREARLLRVRSLLQSKMDTPIESVALAAGFHTMPAFFKAYKERFGETPGQTKSRN